MNDIERASVEAAIVTLRQALGAERASVKVDKWVRWYSIARGELGEEEVHGKGHNPRILEYLHSTNLGKNAANRDETPWCSAFVNWCMEGAGIEGTNSARARSWLGWGEELDEQREGCVVVFKRGKPWQGHVGFIVDIETGWMCLGGNQSDSVSIASYDVRDVLSYRWPV